MDRNAGTPCEICWIAGLGGISTRSDKVLTLAQPDRQGSERGTTQSYWKERSVIRREDDVDGRASVTKDEERVLRGG